MWGDFFIAVAANLATKVGLSVIAGWTPVVQVRWRRAEAGSKNTRELVYKLFLHVRDMPGSRNNVLSELVRAVRMLEKIEEVIVSARRQCEDIDRERDKGTRPDLKFIWDEVEDKKNVQ